MLYDTEDKAEVVEDTGNLEFIVDIENTDVVFTTTLKIVADHGFRRLLRAMLADLGKLSLVFFMLRFNGSNILKSRAVYIRGK